ncbi:glycine--tRNA ligase subunit beta [Propionivibrio limicola]|uniref:glycine--tRNA ligase subunit beta n=1 Tax=Propionivibrio limicola TaxID=167645 RepID=UPI001292035B|nr:glycine--tRNA ligase subunit beta [Propionivibrio limicola]
MNATLLVELLTEELPPKALSRLGEVFANQILLGLSDRNLVAANSAYRWFATPRRLAIQVPHVQATAPDATAFEKIMPVSVALDASGQPTQALKKKLEAKGIALSEVGKFEKRMDGKAEAFFYKATVKGAKLDEVLAGIVAEALKKLPIPKVMRWGDTDHQFVRPVHGLVQLHGDRVVPGELLGLTSRNTTRGHRFLSAGDITLPNADSYAEVLKSPGKVVVEFAERRASIAAQLDAKAKELNATINPSEGLLDEVTALVEWPVVYVGEFESEFLEVPQECLILTMQQNQKYFPLLDASKKLINKFLIVSNMQVDDPKHIVGGNARVVRPRLSDARFFFNQDRKATLASRLDKLASVVYHNKIGSVLQRVERLEALAQKIAVHLNANASLAARAGRLAKADLVTDMVGEFPELQGIMGRYYALHDGEDAHVADAIQSHYQPRFAGDALPAGNIACAAALADKLDALVGFFGIGQIPTGDKDPFGLRRAALGVLRILMETPLPLDLATLIADAAAGFPANVLTQPVAEPLLDFMHDRLRGLLKDAGHAQDAIEAVLAQRPTRIDLVPAKLDAVRDFLHLPEALALAAANKRIGNILKKAEGNLPEPDVALLQEPAEKALFERVVLLAPLVHSHVANEDYGDALKVLASVRAEVDQFFEDVMVNVDEPLIRGNRLGLLKSLFDQLNAVADISKLGV